MDKEEKCDLPSREWRGFESRSCLREIFNFSCNQRQRKIAPNFGIKSGLGHCKNTYEKSASAGNRTRIYCLEGNNANLYTTDAMATVADKIMVFLGKLIFAKIDIKTLTASAGNRTRIYCLEGNNANLYTTDAVAKGTLKRGCMIGKQDEMNMHFFQHIFFY